LMTDPNSPIIEFYPTSFELDLNGKKALWQAVALLPWIDEKRLLDEIAKIEPSFSPEEKDRNVLGTDFIFVHASHPLAQFIRSQLYNDLDPKKLAKKQLPTEYLDLKTVTIDKNLGINGTIAPFNFPFLEKGSTLKSSIGLQPLSDLSVVASIFVDPPALPHVSRLLPGLKYPPPVLQPGDTSELARGGDPRRNRNNMNNNNVQPQKYFGETSTVNQKAPEKMWNSGYNQRPNQPNHGPPSGPNYRPNNNSYPNAHHPNNSYHNQSGFNTKIVNQPYYPLPNSQPNFPNQPTYPNQAPYNNYQYPNSNYAPQSQYQPSLPLPPNPDNNAYLQQFQQMNSFQHQNQYQPQYQNQNQYQNQQYRPNNSNLPRGFSDPDAQSSNQRFVHRR
jgi:5'-3' exonuclease